MSAIQRSLPCPAVEAAYLKVLFYNDSPSTQTQFRSIYCGSESLQPSANEDYIQAATAAVASIDAGLPPNFQGIDELKFVEHLRRAMEGLKKSQFETQDEYLKRVAVSSKTKLAPIDLQATYPSLVP